MERNRIDFDRDELKEKYLEGVFDKRNIEYICKKTGYAEYIFFCGREERDEIISGLVSNFYKLREILKVFSRDNDNDGAFYALIGAMLALDTNEDTIKIKEAFQKTDFVYLDGFYNFCLADLAKSWESMAELTYRLFAQCETTEEIYALCIFLLGMGDNNCNTIVVSPEKKLYIDFNKIGIEIIPYFGVEENDMIVTLLRNRPSDVVITDAAGISPKVLSVIRNLGE